MAFSESRLINLLSGTYCYIMQIHYHVIFKFQILCVGQNMSPKMMLIIKHNGLLFCIVIVLW